MAKKKGQIPAEVIAMRKLLENSIKTCNTTSKSMDQLCYQFNVLKAGFGANVVTITDYTEAVGIKYATFAYNIAAYNKRQQAALGALAGETK